MVQHTTLWVCQLAIHVCYVCLSLKICSVAMCIVVGCDHNTSFHSFIYLGRVGKWEWREVGKVLNPHSYTLDHTERAYVSTKLLNPLHSKHSRPHTKGLLRSPSCLIPHTLDHIQRTYCVRQVAEPLTLLHSRPHPVGLLCPPMQISFRMM